MSDCCCCRVLGEVLEELKKLNTKKERTKKNTTVHEQGLPKIAALWNEWAHHTLPRVRSMESGSTRYKNATARWESNPDEAFWVSVIKKINESTFLLGKNDRKWCADIEFLCRPDQAARILEGRFDDRRTQIVAEDEKVLHGYWYNPDTQRQEPVYRSKNDGVGTWKK